MCWWEKWARCGAWGVQSRRLEVRLRTPKVPGSDLNRKDFVHMLNCTLSATERTLCCVLENYQTPDGVRCDHPWSFAAFSC